MTESLANQLRLLASNESTMTSTSASPSNGTHDFSWLQNTPINVVRDAVELVFALPTTQWIEESAAVASVLVEVVRRQLQDTFQVSPNSLELLKKTYLQLEPHPALRAIVLRVLIGTRDQLALRTFAELLVFDALEPRLLLEVFGDLLKHHHDGVRVVFPKLLDGLDTLGLASFALDYANFVQRKDPSGEHPAAPQAEKLMGILSNLADRLGKLQESQPASEEDVAEFGRQATEGVALAVAICDALAQIGDDSAIACLNKSLAIQHRRLRVEASAALAKLGVEDAGQMLIAMAAEPAERLRVLAYADELGLVDEVDDEFSSYLGRCEAQLVMFLAQPSNYGLAPQHIELLDQCEQYWPGFEEPQTCFLFQFVYQFPEGEFTNIGIAGPVVMKMNVDLTHLSYDDIYAMFAGWHVEHPEIFAVEADRTVGSDEIAMNRMLRSLTEAEEFEDIVPVLFGNVLERHALIASARKQEETGWAMVCEDSVSWTSLGHPQCPIGAGEAFYLFTGRSLLNAFN